jgi:hypothetical protein
VAISLVVAGDGFAEFTLSPSFLGVNSAHVLAMTASVVASPARGEAIFLMVVGDGFAEFTLSAANVLLIT